MPSIPLVGKFGNRFGERPDQRFYPRFIYDVNFGILYIGQRLSCHDRRTDDKPLASKGLSGIFPQARGTHGEVLPKMSLLVFE